MGQIKNIKKRFFANKYIYLAQILLALTISVDYAIGDNIRQTFGGWFYVFPLAGVTLGSLPLFRAWNFFRHKYLVLLIGYFLAALFLIFLADIFGPYFQILILLLFLAIYWVGWLGLLVGLSVQALIVLIGAWYQFGTLSDDLIYVLLVHFATLAISGILFERVSLKHRTKADPAGRLYRTISFERTRLTSLINSMADAVIATDHRGKILLYNGAALDLLNTNLSLEGRRTEDFLKLKNPQNRSVNIISDVKKAGRVLKRDDLHFFSNEKQKIDLYIDIAPIYSGPTNRQTGYIMLLRDITKEKSLDEERSEFISVTSHELRTPIAIAEANLSTALLPDMSKGISKPTKELLEQAHNQTVFLGDLINDLTTLARAERGDLMPEIERLNPNEMVEKLVEEYKTEAKSKKLKLEVGEVKSQEVWTSPLYVREILQNFVTNALKYTPQGQITLGVKDAGPGRVVFSVKDTGVGISSSDKSKIFSKFYRAEDYHTRSTRGTGLGLYITLKLAEKIKAKIWFDSKLNKGSVFYLEVPILHPHHSRKK